MLGLLEFLRLPTLRLLEATPATEQEPAILQLSVFGRSFLCPHCQRPARKVHSRYKRTLADLPAGGREVCLRVIVRRFFCPNKFCSHRTFAEPLTNVAARYARRTQRLLAAQTQISQAVGSRPGVRLAIKLAMPTSPTTLLRFERSVPVPAFSTPRVLGVDDWAFKKGHRYGTILFDLETHLPVDLLSDRLAKSLVTWLKAHPGVEIISRDRAGAYAEGARQGAPDAVQVADRWHLVKNLGQALESLLQTQRAILNPVVVVPEPSEPIGPPVETAVEIAALVVPAKPLTAGQERRERGKQCQQEYRQELFEQVRTLFEKGVTISAIARQLQLSRHTVRQWIRAESLPVRKVRAMHSGTLDPYKPFLLQQWQAGCHNGADLFRQIQAQGYRGGYSLVKAWLQTLSPSPSDALQAPAQKLSPRQIVAWLLRRSEDRTSDQQSVLDDLAQRCPLFKVADALSQRFLCLIRQAVDGDPITDFREWLGDVKQSGIGELCSYANGLQKDQAAVEAGLSLEWSNGAVEGSVNRLKFLKRRGYGRANFDLLRGRVLQPN